MSVDWYNILGSPVMNLRDKLVVAICNDGDQFVTQTGEFLSVIRTPHIHLLFGARLNVLYLVLV